MTRVPFKYLHCFRDRHGKARYYFRYRGRQWSLPAPGSEGFATAYDKLLAEIKTNPMLAVRNVVFMPGSLGWAVEKFLASPSYEARAPTTKQNYRRVLDTLRERYGGGLLKDLRPDHSRTIRNDIREAHKTAAADIALGLISTIWEFAAEELGLQLGADPTHGVKRIHKVAREHEPWPQDLIDRFMREARPSLRWAVRLALGTGQRRSDLVKMKWSQFDGEFIEVRQQKTGELLSIPCDTALRKELENMPRRGETILVGERGGPLTAASLGTMIRRAMHEMGVKGYPIHGLRKNAANVLSEAGCSDREIMAITGHKTVQMVSHYTKRRDQKALAMAAIEKRERAESGKPKNATG